MPENKRKRSEATITGMLLAVFATFLARGVGFVRELLTASIFGTSIQGDAFIIALTIPDVLVSGFSSAIASLYIPTYLKIKAEDKKGTKAAEFNSSVFLLLLLIGVAFVSVVQVSPLSVVKLFASGFKEEELKITASLVQITAFAIVPIFLGSYFKSYGQIVNKFAFLTLLSVVINAMIIGALLFYDGQNIETLAYSVILGNVIYMALAYVVIKKEGFKLSPKMSLRNSYLKGMLIGIAPVFASNIIAEINQIVDKNFASQLTSGTISALNYSAKIINLITAILGTAISSVLFSELSKKATSGDHKSLAREVEKIHCTLFAFLLPIMYFIAFYSVNIIELLFGRGNFGSDSIKITAECLAFYSIGIIGFNLKAVWVRVYNASLNTKTPAINSAIAVVCNIVLNILLIRVMQHRGLALATGLSSLFTDILLILQYQKCNEAFDLKGVFVESVKCMVASIGVMPVFYMARSYCEKSLLHFVFGGTAALLIGYGVYAILLVGVKSMVGNYLLEKKLFWRREK